MELAQKIIDYFGDDLYTELDVNEVDYETLPAYEFYEKVVKSCEELHPEVVDSLREQDQPEPEPWKVFENANDAQAFLSQYAKSHFYLCVDILEDIFYHDHDYRIFPTQSFRDMREIWLNRAKEEGRESFLERVKRGKDTKKWGAYSLNSFRALARRITPPKCARYCWLNKIMTREMGSYVIWDESLLNTKRF